MVFVTIVRVLTPKEHLEKQVFEAVKKFNNTLFVSFAKPERLIVDEIEKINKQHINKKIVVKRNQISNNTISLVIENYLSFNLTKTTLWED